MEEPKVPVPNESTPPEKPVTTIKVPVSRTVLIGALVVLLILVGGGVYAFSHRRDDPSRVSDEKARQQSEKEQYDREHSTANKTKGSGGSSSSSSSSTSLASSDLFLDQNGEGCVTQDVSFTSPVIPMDQLGFIEPMGKMNDGHVTPTDHVYTHPKNSRAADNTYDAVMPADGTVVGISAMPAQYIGDRNQQTAPEDHRLVISHSCQYFSIFIHVHKLDPALKAIVGTMEPNTSKKVSIKLKAGDKLGGIGSSGFDWTLVDTKTKLTGFITPSLYEGEPWKIHAIDPLSVYTGSMKTSLEALSMRSTAPFGGKIDYDKKGALIGNWFRENTGGYSGNSGNNEGRYWDGHLAIAPDHIDQATTIVSLGNWDGSAKQLSVKGTVDPSTVTTASGPVKYELLSLAYALPSGTTWTGNETFAKGIKVDQKNASVVGTVMFEVQAGEKLKVEKFIGKTADQVTAFTSAAQTYSR